MQPKLTTVRMCQPAIWNNTVCITNIKLSIMKSKLFVLGLFLLAFSFLYAAQSNRNYTKKIETSENKNTAAIHPAMFPLHTFE